MYQINNLSKTQIEYIANNVPQVRSAENIHVLHAIRNHHKFPALVCMLKDGNQVIVVADNYHNYYDASAIDDYYHQFCGNQTIIGAIKRALA